MFLTPAYYYDLYADIDGQLQIIETNFPVWLSEQDFEREWVNLNKSLFEYKELRKEMEKDDELVVPDDNILSTLLEDPVEHYRKRKIWNQFRQGYINKTKQNLIHRYNLTLYKAGKWINTVVDTTFKLKEGDDSFINYLRNINNCTEKLNLKPLLQHVKCNEIKLVAITKDTLLC